MVGVRFGPCRNDAAATNRTIPILEPAAYYWLTTLIPRGSHPEPFATLKGKLHEGSFPAATERSFASLRMTPLIFSVVEYY